MKPISLCTPSLHDTQSRCGSEHLPSRLRRASGVRRPAIAALVAGPVASRWRALSGVDLALTTTVRRERVVASMRTMARLGVTTALGPGGQTVAVAGVLAAVAAMAAVAAAAGGRRGRGMRAAATVGSGG